MNNLIYLLKPTSLEFVMYAATVVVLFVVTSFNKVLDALIAESEAGEIDSVAEIFGSNVDSFTSGFGSSSLSATMTTLIFWSAAGAVVYIVVWSLFNGIKEFYDETAQADTKVRALGSDKDSEFKQNLGRLIFRITSVIVLIAYIITSIRLLVPLWLEYFRASVTHLDSLEGWAQLTIAIVGGMITIHGYTILARMITLRLRAYGDFGLIEEKPR